METELTGIKRRGFASMTAERRREISAMGGTEAHRTGRAHQFTSEEAAVAGSKGGLARMRNRAAVRKSLSVDAQKGGAS